MVGVTVGDVWGNPRKMLEHAGDEFVACVSCVLTCFGARCKTQLLNIVQHSSDTSNLT